jgi:peptidase E
MVKLYFLGGENVARRDAREINERAFQDAGGTPAVAVFSWARPSFDRKFVRRKMLFNYFRSLGVRVVNFVDYSDSRDKIACILLHSDLVYLTGGQLSVLVTRLRKTGVDCLLRDYKGVVVGRSAGALALSKKCVVTERYSKAVKMVDGLGLFDFNLKVHYEPSSDELLKILSKNGKIYAIPERAAIIQEKGVLTSIGDVCLFDAGEKTRVC